MEDRGVARGENVMGIQLSGKLEVEGSYICWLARIAQKGTGGKDSVYFW